MNQDYLRLKKYQRVWKEKPLLRLIYREWYVKIDRDLQPGKTLELGSGIGNFKKFKPEIISSDIVKCEWLDKRIDAHYLPFPGRSLGNIVMIDVLHHLGRPLQLFNEAYRVLKPGGRVILLEPFPSPFSLLIYKLFHPEPFIFNDDVFSWKANKKLRWESNQAVAYLLFFKGFARFKRLFQKKLILVRREKFSFLLYPLSGGFENKQLIPDWSLPLIRVIEKLLYPLRRLLSFRCYVVLQKS